MNQLTTDITGAITGTIRQFIDPSQRLFLPFIAAAAIIAMVVCLRRRESVASVFQKDIFLHPSARMDYRLLFVNAAVKASLWSGIVVGTLSVVAAVHGALTSLFGQVGLESWLSWQVTAVYTIVLFVAHDGSRYLLHRLMHAVPALWQFHQVHHSAEVLTPVTVHRVHPVESFLYTTRAALTTGVVTGVFFYVFGGAVSQGEFLGVNAIGITLTALGANLRHSHVWLSYGRLERFLMSPAQHQMHHDRAAAAAHVNFGAFLAIWDRLARSWQRAFADLKPEAFGLTSANHRTDSVMSAYAGPVASWAAELGATVGPKLPKPATAVLAVSAMQCTTDGPAETGPDADYSDFDRLALVSNLADNHIVPRYRDALGATTGLASAIDSYCGAIDSEAEIATLDTSREAWRAAMLQWQRAEVTNIGPATKDALGLRDAIYSWPITNACAVDQGVVDARNNASFSIAGQLPNRRGLDSLEYLLFTESEDSVCAPVIYPEGWDDLTSVEKRQARCAYAQLLARDVENSQNALVSAWTDEGGYLQELKAPGQDGSPITNPQLAVNEVFNGLFYLYTATREEKLGTVVGVTEHVSCPTKGIACPAVLESKFAHFSKEMAAANLEAFTELYLGGEGLGFDDFLQAKDAGELDQRMQDALQNAALAFDSISGSLGEALESDFAGVQAVFEATGPATTLLKTEIPSILQLDVPQQAAGDAD